MTKQEMITRLEEVKKEMEEMESKRYELTLNFHKAMEELSKRYAEQKIEISYFVSETELISKRFAKRMDSYRQKWSDLDDEAIELERQI